MQLKTLPAPRLPGEAPPWRTLYLRRRFEQRRLLSPEEMRREAEARGLWLGMGQEQWQEWDEHGSLCPIAFGLERWQDDFLLDPDESDTVRFREEAPYREWSHYEIEVWEEKRSYPLYSPWQVLPLHDVLGGLTAEIPLFTLLDDLRRAQWVDTLKNWLEGQKAAWVTLHQRWAPTLKLLTALQNRFWPAVSGRVVLPFDVEQGERRDPLEEEAATFDPQQVLAEHNLSETQLAGVYEWLCDRGARLESHHGGLRDLGGDRWGGLRMLADRRVRGKMRGRARAAMDFYEAAEMIGRCWYLMTGRYLPAVDVAPYRRTTRPIDHDAGASNTHERSPTALRAKLAACGVWPGRVHAVVEGQSEQLWVEALLEAGLGWIPDDLLITNLHGAGEAKRMKKLVETIADYATSSALILDAEGEMAKHTSRLIDLGLVDSRDVLLVDSSFEERNFSDAELAAVARYIGRHPPGNRPKVALRLSAKDLRKAHDAKVAAARRGEEPGIAETLLAMARDPARGPVNITKVELNSALIAKVLADLEERRAQVVEDARPIVQFVFQRIGNPLLNSAWR